MKSFEEFKEALKDEAFRKELAAYLAEKKPETKESEVQTVVEFASVKGYAVTAEELGIESAKVRELTDDEVDNIVGGNALCWENSACFFVDRNLLWDIVFDD